MKRLLVLLLIPLVFACDSDDKKNDLDQLNLNGKVKLLKETSYSVVEKFGEPIKDEFESQTEYFFNEEGFYKEYNFFYGNGELNQKRKYKYDDDGNRIEESEYDTKGELVGKWKYKYDDNGNRIEQSGYSEDMESGGKSKFKYDDDGNLIEEIIYDNDEEFWGKIKFKYDDDGNLIEESYYASNGELLSKEKYKNDDDGNMIERSFDIDGELQDNWKYKYENFDNNKNWLKSIVYKDGKATEIIEREIEYYD